MPSARSETRLLAPAMGSALVAALAWGSTITLVLVDGDDGMIASTAAIASTASTATIVCTALHVVRSASRAVQTAIRTAVSRLAERVDGIEIGFEYGRKYSELTDRQPATVRHLSRR